MDDQKVAEKYLRIMLQPEKHAGIPEVWRFALDRALQLIEQHRQRIEDLGKAVLEAMTGGREAMNGDEVRKVVCPSGIDKRN